MATAACSVYARPLEAPTALIALLVWRKPNASISIADVRHPSHRTAHTASQCSQLHEEVSAL